MKLGRLKVYCVCTDGGKFKDSAKRIKDNKNKTKQKRFYVLKSKLFYESYFLSGREATAQQVERLNSQQQHAVCIHYH